MFDDPNNNQASQDEFNSTNDNDPTPPMGLGGTPDPSYSSSAVPADDNASPAAVSEPDQPPVVEPQQDTPATDTPAPASNGLDDLKRQALDELSPLVHKLDQDPEERYKTLMMLIQASDNQDLLNEAYAAAQKITDEKVKAEALLNIVNEINYFSQKG